MEEKNIEKDIKNDIPKENKMGYKPIKELLREFTVPTVLSMLVGAIYNIVDQIFIGRGVNYLGNAATTIAFPLMIITMGISILFSVGCSAYGAIKLGENKIKDAEKSLSYMVFFLIILGVSFSTLTLSFLKPILIFFGATEKILPYAMDYTSVILFGSTFNMLSIGLAKFSRVDGNPKISLYSMLAGVILNVILDPIYIFVFHWGVWGAAIATITAQIISTIILLNYFSKNSKLKIKFSYIKTIDFSILRGCLKLGMSAFLLQIANTVIQIILTKSLNHYGSLSDIGADISISAIGVIMKISGIIVSTCVGISTGSQPIMGFNTGAKKYSRVKETFKIALTWATTVSTTFWLLIMLFPRQVISIFETSNVEFTNFASYAIRIILAPSFVFGFLIMTMGYFLGTGQANKSIIFTILKPIVMIPLLIILPRIFGLNGLIFVIPISDTIASIVSFIFIRKEIKKLNNLIKTEDLLNEENIELKNAELI